MFLLDFYRLYVSLIAGGLVYFVAYRHWWVWPAVAIAVRVVWLGIEMLIKRIVVDRDVSRHLSEFRQLYGPYGIRIANKAESDRRVKTSLAEVCAEDRAKLAKAVEQLEVMDTLFNAGMRPEGDEFLLHDLKLKFGKHRLGSDGAGSSAK